MIDSRQKAEELCRRGELVRLLLLPPEFGGEDVPPNVVYVPAFAAEIKARIDRNNVMSLADQGQVRRYSAEPQYAGESFVPTEIRIVAHDPGRFEASIAIWGEPVQRPAKPEPSPDKVTRQFEPGSTSLEGMAPEDVVRAFNADYKRWNDYAFMMSDDGQGMDAAESAYGKLVARFCPPGIKHEPVAFGSDSSHDGGDVILGTELGTDSCIVRARHAQPSGNSSFESDYEYHLQREGSRWYLTNVFYVDGAGKYEAL